ncbi:MAG: Rid family detoxifying hydrolase [Nitrososphaerota archaeon]
MQFLKDMVKEIIYTGKAPKPVASYSQAIRCDKLLFISGQLGIDVSTGKLAEGFEEQTRKAFQNIKTILESAGYKIEDVVRVTIYLKSQEYFKSMNILYEEFFRNHKPTRTTIIASPPLQDALIEVDVIAYRED